MIAAASLQSFPARTHGSEQSDMPIDNTAGSRRSACRLTRRCVCCIIPEAFVQASPRTASRVPDPRRWFHSTRPASRVSGRAISSKSIAPQASTRHCSLRFSYTGSASGRGARCSTHRTACDVEVVMRGAEQWFRSSGVSRRHDLVEHADSAL
jgi:hypothetical protein